MNRAYRRVVEKRLSSKCGWKRTYVPTPAAPVGNGNAYFAAKIKGYLKKNKEERKS